MNTEVETEVIAVADGVLSKHATGRPGQLLLTFLFEGQEREATLPVVLRDHELLRVTVERLRYPGETPAEGDVWANAPEPTT